MTKVHATCLARWRSEDPSRSRCELCGEEYQALRLGVRGTESTWARVLRVLLDVLKYGVLGVV